MTDQGSPGTGASMTTNGFVIPRDRAKHRAELETITWETATRDPMTLQATHVRELSPTAGDEPEDERTFTSEELEALPEFLRDSFEPEPPPASASTPSPRPATTPRPSGKTPRKFEFREALRGRIGDGDHQITRPEFVALAMLETYASADLTSARPGHARLAEDLGYTGTDPQRIVRRLLASLTRKGYLVVTHHGTNVVGNVATEYRLTLPEWE